MTDWDKFFLDMATMVASRSKDTSMKCGAVFVRTDDNSVLSTGYNGLPRNIEYTPEKLERPTKYFVMEHAERNAIYNAVRNGVALLNSTCYITGLPCADCARAIIQVGTKRIVLPADAGDILLDPNPDRTWIPGVKAGLEILAEASVSVEYFGKKL